MNGHDTVVGGALLGSGWAVILAAALYADIRRWHCTCCGRKAESEPIPEDLSQKLTSADEATVTGEKERATHGTTASTDTELAVSKVTVAWSDSRNNADWKKV